KLQIERTSAGQATYSINTATSGTNYGIDCEALGVGASTNIGGYFAASGGGSNYAIIVPQNFGSVGIGTSAPTALLSVNGTANKPGGGSWDVFSDERLKNIKGSFTPGLSAVMRLQPLRYSYKKDNALSFDSNKNYVGFGAQELQKVIPEAVTTN